MSDDIRIPVKLFVSKFPTSFSEDDLREVFAKFGDLESLVVLKSKESTRYQGCGFVRFTSVTDAARAIRELNNKLVIDEDLGPLNVEYASGEAERLNLPATAEGTSLKLFVGGVPLALSEDEIRQYFSQYGQVTECHILPPKTGNPAIVTKAAFVRFSRKADALQAVETLDKKIPFPGAQRPMDVRVAETKQALVPQQQQQQQQQYGQQQGVYQQHGGGQPQRVYQQPYGQGPQQGGLQQGPPHALYQPQYGQQQVPQHGMFQQQIYPPAAPNSGPRTIGTWTEYFASDGRPYYHNGMTNVTSWDPPVEFRLTHGQQHPQLPSDSGPQAKGPAGANLFVFHVPNEWTEAELFKQFSPFGNLVSYRVARERDTNRPKGFAFVSYDSASAAAGAIASLNGMVVSTGKRLKVSVKKGEEVTPY